MGTPVRVHANVSDEQYDQLVNALHHQWRGWMSRLRRAPHAYSMSLRWATVVRPACGQAVPMGLVDHGWGDDAFVQ